MNRANSIDQAGILALGRRALRFLDERRLDDWELTMAPDAVFDGPGMRLQGRAQIREFVESFHQTFPDVTHRIDRLLVAGGDALVMEGVFSGTQAGPLRTPAGDVPPTGKRVEVREAQLTTVGRGGLAAHFSTYFDRLEMMAQLGLAAR